MTITIVLFNGPPHCGKDTVSEMMAKNFNGTVRKFAGPLKIAVNAIYLTDYERFLEEDSPEKKGLPSETFFGKSCREVQIAISENLMKPLHGKEVFGKLLSKDIIRDTQRGIKGPFFISDSGFVEEAEVLCREFGPTNIMLVRIHREGCDFSKDSRSYVYLDHMGVQSIDLINDGTLQDLETTTIEILKPFLEE